MSDTDLFKEKYDLEMTAVKQNKRVKFLKIPNRLQKLIICVSHASEAALSSVLRMATLSYGNIRFSGTCPAETPQPITVKFCTID
jgi:hypothetical protein